IPALTDLVDRGRYAAVYYPNPADSGLFEVGAQHPSEDRCTNQAQWTVLGMQVQPASAYHRRFLDDSNLTKVAQLVNTGSLPLYNISVQLRGFGPPLTRLIVKPSNRTATSDKLFLSDLDGGQSMPFDIELDANGSVRGRIGIIFTSQSGTVAIYWLNLRLDVRTPLLRAN
ncbi:unnamed protein product, partial [Owenia fusiformis]